MIKTLFLEAPYVGKVELCKDVLEFIKRKNYKKIGLFAAVQFCNQLDLVKKQLEKINVKVVTSKAKRCGVEGQLLGCDCFSDSLNLEEGVDAFLYIGDGKFHPLALAYAQRDSKGFKKIIGYNPKNYSFFVIKKEEGEANLKKYRGALTKFHGAGNVGVIISLKPGQEYYQKSLELEKKYPDKKFYYFVDDEISFDQLENFNFIEVWVNTACPRIGCDDIEKFRKGVLNLTDALKVSTLFEKEETELCHEPAGV